MSQSSRFNAIRFGTLALALAACLFSTKTEAQSENDQTPSVRVVGQGESSIAPDMAVVNLAVVREARTAREALTLNNTSMNQVIEAMKEAGIESRDLQTAALSIQPRMVYPRQNSNGIQEEPRIVGYTVSNTLSVRVRDLDKLGEVIDRSVTLGVNSNGNIVFTNDDPEQALREARMNAVADARQRAETLAVAAGVELGPLLEIAENVDRPAPRPLARTAQMNAESDAAVPIETGENTYTVTVQARWQIMQ